MNAETPTMHTLRSKAKAVGVIGWKTMDREDLEFWIREWERVKPKKTEAVD